jgi:hypothetical protein
MEQAVYKLGTIGALSTAFGKALTATGFAGDWSTDYTQPNSLYLRVLSGSLHKSTGPTTDPG